MATATGIGIATSKPSDIYLQDFEAHPRTVTIPELDLGTPWWREGTKIAIKDDFNSWQGDLTGKTTSLGNKVWQKTLGLGAVTISGGIAKVKASVEQPNPGRTAYTVAWNNPSFSDVSVTIFPPGKERGQGEKGRGGLIFCKTKIITSLSIPGLMTTTMVNLSRAFSVLRDLKKLMMRCGRILGMRSLLEGLIPLEWSLMVIIIQCG